MPDIISSIRENFLIKCVASIYEELDNRVNDEYYCPYTEPDEGSPGASFCDAAFIGHIHRHMLRTRGSLLPRSVSDINDSVVELASWMFSLMSGIPIIHSTDYFYGTGSFECSPTEHFYELNERMHESIPEVVASSMTSSHKECMANQREKTGLVMADEQDRSQVGYYWKLYEPEDSEE